MAALRQSSDAPTTKTWAAVIAGAITTIMVWAIRQFGHIDIPAEIAMAIQICVTFATSYLTPPGAKDTVRELVTTPPPPAPPKA